MAFKVVAVHSDPLVLETKGVISTKELEKLLNTGYELEATLFQDLPLAMTHKTPNTTMACVPIIILKPKEEEEETW